MTDKQIAENRAVDLHESCERKPGTVDGVDRVKKEAAIGAFVDSLTRDELLATLKEGRELELETMLENFLIGMLSCGACRRMVELHYPVRQKAREVIGDDAVNEALGEATAEFTKDWDDPERVKVFLSPEDEEAWNSAQAENMMLNYSGGLSQGE